jgi:4-amino-4-deoxy-L-arabinose transferase-like glycosyltransferase
MLGTGTGAWPADGEQPAGTADSGAAARVRAAPWARTARARWRVWRSPPDQPRWARPALLALAALAGLSYAWGADSASLEPFYGAAARSMSTSWHDFLFGAFDPAGTITVDKLPGALWPQALSLRIFGFHIWALVLPQVLEGVATILVLYRAVRLLAGPHAAIAAALVLAASPATTALNRGNVADSLFVLLAVLAACSTSAALRDGRPGHDWPDAEPDAGRPRTRNAIDRGGGLRHLLLAGVWIGLAFQAKMLEAWLVFPALALAYLLAAPPPALRTRAYHVALSGVVAVVVSLSWISVVSLVPAHSRPYVDGSTNDSLFSAVFDYNGAARLGHGNSLPSAGPPAPFLVDLYHEGSTFAGEAFTLPPSWHRLLSGLFGRQDAWLLIVALAAGLAVLIARRRAPRCDPLRACVLLWGTQLLLFGIAFSEGYYLNLYYAAALMPALAGLCGAGVALVWPRRESPRVRAALIALLLATLAYGAYLLHGGVAVPGWVLPLALCLFAAAVLALLAEPRLRARAGARATGNASTDGQNADLSSRGTAGARSRKAALPRTIAPLLAAAALLALPAAACALVVARGIGPFEAPFARAGAARSQAATAAAVEQAVEQLSSTYSTPIVLATDTSTLASTYVFYTGAELLPIGGYLGGVPSPTLAALRRDIAAGQVRAFLIPVEPPSADPRIEWVRTHCSQLTTVRQSPRVLLGVYDCTPATGAH